MSELRLESDNSPADQDDLHSGTPIWRLLGKAPATVGPLDRDAECDVAIVGGGITGALAAERLLAEGLRVIILDAERFAQGSTIASTGLLDFETDATLLELIAKFGETAAARTYQCGLEAIDKLESLVDRLGIDCGFARRPTLKFASLESDLPKMSMEAEARQRFGFDTRLLERDQLAELGGFSAAGALWSHGNAELDPYRFTQGLLANFLAQGGRAYGGSPVESIAERAAHVLLTTKGGIRITADRVIIAAGYLSGQFSPPQVGALRTSYAVASQPLGKISRWPENCLIWETARPYFYARRTLDGRAIIGGEDTASPQDHENLALLREKVGCLVRRFEQLFGSPFRPAAAWAGVFGESADGLPYIGLPPGHERIYFAMGYGGNGITFGKLAADILTDLIVGRTNADATLFRFGR